MIKTYLVYFEFINIILGTAAGRRMNGVAMSFKRGLVSVLTKKYKRYLINPMSEHRL